MTIAMFVIDAVMNIFSKIPMIKPSGQAVK